MIFCHHPKTLKPYPKPPLSTAPLCQVSRTLLTSIRSNHQPSLPSVSRARETVLFTMKEQKRNAAYMIVQQQIPRSTSLSNPIDATTGLPPPPAPPPRLLLPLLFPLPGPFIAGGVTFVEYPFVPAAGVPIVCIAIPDPDLIEDPPDAPVGGIGGGGWG